MSFEEGRPIGALVGQGLLMTDITIENRGIRLAASVDGPADGKAFAELARRSDITVKAVGSMSHMETGGHVDVARHR